jgi:hypothetical protein
MTSFTTGVSTLLTIGLVLTASPSFAQREGRRGGDEQQRQGVDRGRTHRNGEVRGHAQPRAERQQRFESQGRNDSNRGRNDQADRRPPEGNRSFDNRGNNSRDNRGSNSRSYNGRSYDNRSYQNRGYNSRPYDGRFHDNRWYGNRDYGWYRPRPYPRSYVVPYGYRPYGYRPGWSLNLYFGQPYSTYGYPAYPYAQGYGYYSVIPGRAYGALRIVDAPPDAQVLVDGYYAGVVDNYDGVFQHLNLEVGPHHIEIEAAGYPPVAFDVRIEPGRTVTFSATRGY